MYPFQIVGRDVLLVGTATLFDVFNQAFGVLVEEYVQIWLDNLIVQYVEEFAIQDKLVVGKSDFREDERFENIVIGYYKFLEQIHLSKLFAHLLVALCEERHF